jgi:hypothetical protein
MLILVLPLVVVICTEGLLCRNSETPGPYASAGLDNPDCLSIIVQVLSILINVVIIHVDSSF